MTDARLRAAEREWRAHGDQSAYLRELGRVGFYAPSIRNFSGPGGWLDFAVKLREQGFARGTIQHDDGSETFEGNRGDVLRYVVEGLSDR